MYISCVIIAIPTKIHTILTNICAIPTIPTKICAIPTKYVQFRQNMCNSDKICAIPTKIRAIPTIPTKICAIPTKYVQIPTSGGGLRRGLICLYV